MDIFKLFSISKAMKLALTLLLVSIVQSAVYNLIKQVNVELAVDPSYTICQTMLVYQTLYSLAINGTHLIVSKYHFPDSFILQDQSPSIVGLYNGIPNSVSNPSMVKIDTTGIMVKHTDGPNFYLTVISPSDLSSSVQHTLPDNLHWLHLSTIDGVFYRTEAGATNIATRFTKPSQSIVYSTSSTPLSLDDILILESQEEVHIASIDKSTGQVTLTKFTYDQGAQTVTNSEVTVIQINTTISGGCFHKQDQLYIMTSINKIYQIRLATLIIIEFNKIYIPTAQCYYDFRTNSLITMEQTNIDTVSLTQLSLSNTDTIVYQIEANHITMLNSRVFYLAYSHTITTFQAKSCVDPYQLADLKCWNCDTGCDVCNGSYYCRQCAQGWFNGYISSFQSIFIQECLACVDNCSVCISVDTSGCTQCISGFEFDNNTICIPMNIDESQGNSTSNSMLMSIVDSIDKVTSVLANPVPSARAIFKPLLYAMVSFDDLFPYMYHERGYGDTLEELFVIIRTVEVEKWAYYDQYVVNPFLQVIGVDRDGFEASLDRYRDYSSPTFLRRESVGESVLIAAFSFLTTNFLLSVALFLLCRGLFRLLFRYRLSRIFRPESFWTFLPFFVMEGNLQIVTFYACSVLRLNFFRNRAQKLQVAAIYLGLYLLFFFGVAGYLLVFQKLRRLSKYFSDNLTPSFPATVFLTIEFGLKNLLLALIHSLFRSQSLFRVQLSSLAAVELLCLGNCLLFLRRKGCFELRIKAWASVVIGSLRFLLILSLWLQQESLRDALLLEVIESAIKTVLTLYFGLTFLMLGASLLHCLVEAFRFIRLFMSSKPKDRQKNKTTIKPDLNSKQPKVPQTQNTKEKSSEKNKNTPTKSLSRSKSKSKNKLKKTDPTDKVDYKSSKYDSKNEVEPKIDRKARAIKARANQKVRFQKDAAQVVGRALMASMNNGNSNRFNGKVEDLVRYAPDQSKAVPEKHLPIIRE